MPPIVTPPNAATCTACLDPHLTFAHGGRADFKGKDKTWYPMLSARNMTFNAYFVHDDFKNLYKVVHGSAMKSTTWVMRTNATGRVVTVEYNSTAGARSRALVRVSDTLADEWIYHGSKPFKLENIRVEMRERKLTGVGKGGWHGTALIVSDGRWLTTVWNKPYPNAAANPGKSLLNIHLEALYDADKDRVAPHGLIGQSYDGDGLATDGRKDDYSANEVTTTAMAEGAIEGDASDYELRHRFATRFKYSRYDAEVAKHRNVDLIRAQGANHAAPHRSGGATADIEDDDSSISPSKEARLR